MSDPNEGWVARRRRLFMRPNAQLYVRPDAHHFMPSEPPRWATKEELRLFWGKFETDRQPPHDHSDRSDISAEIEELFRLKRELAEIKALLHARRQLREAKYSPNQSRVPAGNPDGGQWTSEGATGSPTAYAQYNSGIRDVDGRPYYRPGGHHEMPEAVHRKWNLSPETRRIFLQSSTGELNATFRTSPEPGAVVHGNVWRGTGGLHLAYNQAVEELSTMYMRDNKLKPDGSNMAPDHARAILKLIRESEDPRIRDFNLNMRRIQRLQRIRGGGDD